MAFLNSEFDGVLIAFFFHRRTDTFGCFFDGLVTCATTNIATESRQCIFLVGFCITQTETGQRNHEARSTESTLGSRFIRHSLLHQIELFHIQPFDGQHVFSVNVSESRQTGSGRLVLHTAIFEVADQNSAGTAIAFAATNFGSHLVLMVPDEIQQQGSGRQSGMNFFLV